jgi:hypothetical protein
MPRREANNYPYKVVRIGTQFAVVQHDAVPPYRPSGEKLHNDVSNAQRRKRQLNAASKEIDEMVARDGAIII